MFGEQLKIAWHALATRKTRSLLTLSTVGIGCFAIVLASSLAASGLASLKQSIEEIGGARLIIVDPKQPERAEKKQAGLGSGLTEADQQALSDPVPHLESFTHFATLGEQDALSDLGRSGRADLVAADANYFDLFRMRVAAGRQLVADDLLGATQNCVIGPDIASALWQQAPLGRKLSIGQLHCRVVGVFADNNRWGTNFGFDWNNVVVVPYSTAKLRLADLSADSGIALRTDARESNAIVKRLVNARLERNHAGIDDYSIFDLGQVMDRFETTFALLELLVGLFSGIALLIGGVGIMNMMLVSVSERVKEIGIRKALGATPANLSQQFLIEANLLSITGGFAGVAAGFAAVILSAMLIRSGMPGWISVLSWPAALVALAAAGATGAAFGWLPARKAARLDPVEAMRK